MSSRSTQSRSSGYSTWSGSAGRMEYVEQLIIKEEEPDIGIDVEDPSLQEKG